jgi:hypothetical protein
VVGWAYYLCAFVLFQVIVVLLQQRLGPTFFLPKRVGRSVTLEVCTIDVLPSPTSLRPQKHTTITHHYRSLFLTPKHQTTRSAIVPSVWKRFMQRTPIRYSMSPSVYYRKSGEGRIIAWRRAIIYSCVTRLPGGCLRRDLLVFLPSTRTVLTSGLLSR